MVVSFRVFKKASPNGKITIYLGRRDFIDHVTESDPVDGVLLIDKDYLQGKQVYAQLVCSFRYGREDEETMGLSFKKELTLADEQVYPPSKASKSGQTRLQERLVKKLGKFNHFRHVQYELYTKQVHIVIKLLKIRLLVQFLKFI